MGSDKSTLSAKQFAKTKQKYGYPKLVFYSGAKTNSKNIADAFIILNEKKEML